MTKKNRILFLASTSQLTDRLEQLVDFNAF